MDIVKERSTAYISVSFVDKNGAAAVPSTVTYSTKCTTTGTAIKTNVSVTPASTVTITLDSLDNTIQNANNNSEQKALTVRSSYGTNDECNDDYFWSVSNLLSV
jgi:hypothetical protein